MKIIYSEFTKSLDGSKPEIETFKFGAGCSQPVSVFISSFLPKLCGWISDALMPGYCYGIREFKFTITIKR